MNRERSNEPSPNSHIDTLIKVDSKLNKIYRLTTYFTTFVKYLFKHLGFLQDSLSHNKKNHIQIGVV